MSFLLFAGEDYYPLGGGEDFVGSFKTVNEAIKGLADYCKELGELVDWANIFDTKNNKIVKKYATVCTEKERDVKRWVEGDHKEWQIWVGEEIILGDNGDVVWDCNKIENSIK